MRLETIGARVVPVVSVGVMLLSLPTELCAQTASTSVSSASPACKSVSIRAVRRNSAIDKYTHILKARIEERTGIVPTAASGADCEIRLSVRNAIGNEGFRIESESPRMVRIVGNDERGLLYGIGKLLRTSGFRTGFFTLSSWRGTSIPKNKVRGVYFATHFHNYYNDAPVDDIHRYVEDLALWGVNALSVAYDMHSFSGLEDPDAQAMMKRLHDLLSTAREVGMSTALMLGANQAYKNSPKELRAVGPGRGEFNTTDLCPRKPGARSLLLKQFSEEFQRFADIGIDYITIWPYDASSCGCELCHPWGSNGFLYISESIATIARQYFPKAQITLSTWYFDEVEWDGLAKAFRTKPRWVDYLLAEPLGHSDAYVLKHAPPGDLPVIGFPEISMAGMYPWGGFGANPQPARFERDWKLVRQHFRGGFAYSEGIYEDLNKVVYAQFYWDPERSAMDTVREYLSYEFLPSAVTNLTRVVEILEHNHHYRWWPGGKRDYNFPGHELWWKPPKGIQKDANTAEAFGIVQSVDSQLSEYSKNSWRWRIIYLRALLDEEFRRSDDQPTARAKQAIGELVKIYHADQADAAVKPAFK